MAVWRRTLLAVPPDTWLLARTTPSYIVAYGSAQRRPRETGAAHPQRMRTSINVSKRTPRRYATADDSAAMRRQTEDSTAL